MTLSWKSSECSLRLCVKTVFQMTNSESTGNPQLLDRLDFFHININRQSLPDKNVALLIRARRFADQQDRVASLGQRDRDIHDRFVSVRRIRFVYDGQSRIHADDRNVSSSKHFGCGPIHGIQIRLALFFSRSRIGAGYYNQHRYSLFSFINRPVDYNVRTASQDTLRSPHKSMEQLSGRNAIKQAALRMRELINAREEWIYATSTDSATSALRRSEIDFRVAQNSLSLKCLSDEGTAIWRINGWEWTGERLLLDADRGVARDRVLVELIPRASVDSINAVVSQSRLSRCFALARLACNAWPDSRVVRVGLSAGGRRQQPGRYARILLERKKERIAVTATVAEDEGRGIDAFLSSALIWFTRLGDKPRPPRVGKLWICARSADVPGLEQSIALLRSSLGSAIKLFKIDAEWESLASSSPRKRDELWKVEPPRLPRYRKANLSEFATHVVSLAPHAVDVVRARHGETLRFHGLSFARVRRVMNRDRIWFGIEGARRRLLDESNFQDWDRLWRDLNLHRNAETGDPGNNRHALYRASPEAWLESLLRRDITRLDPGLRLAPLHAQFRTSPPTPSVAARPVDLLALRRDGRLVVIELKVAEDREHVLQGADYWRRVESHRRAGNITRAALFGDAWIADEPPLVYLAAPTLRYHRAFDLLARMIAPDIRMYRFDLNEDWRSGVRVMRRLRLSS